MKKKATVISILCVFGISLWACMLLYVFGGVTFSCEGFGIDTAGHLYIGIRDEIYVYDAEVLQRTFPAITNRGYGFTLLENDTILWSTGSTVYITDLNGNTLSKEADAYAKVYTKLKGQSLFQAANGNTYTRETWPGGFRICQNGAAIYTHPFYNTLVLIAGILSAGVVIPCIIWLFKRKP